MASRRTTMTALATQIERKYNTLYFTENPPSGGIDDNLWDYKYFLLFKNTFSVFRKYKTQQEAIDDMTEILKEDQTELFNFSVCRA